jgi:hypothetical protein
VDDLAAAVQATPPPEFDVRAPGDRTDLAELVERAAQERSALLDRAIDDSLRHLPALVRLPVKRALGM